LAVLWVTDIKVEWTFAQACVTLDRCAPPPQSSSFRGAEAMGNLNFPGQTADPSFHSGWQHDELSPVLSVGCSHSASFAGDHRRRSADIERNLSTAGHIGRCKFL